MSRIRLHKHLFTSLLFHAIISATLKWHLLDGMKLEDALNHQSSSSSSSTLSPISSSLSFNSETMKPKPESLPFAHANAATARTTSFDHSSSISSTASATNLISSFFTSRMPSLCLILSILLRYFRSTNYLWMFNEALYLHQLIKHAFTQPSLRPLIILAYCLPFITTSSYIVARTFFLEAFNITNVFGGYRALNYPISDTFNNHHQSIGASVENQPPNSVDKFVNESVQLFNGKIQANNNNNNNNNDTNAINVNKNIEENIRTIDLLLNSDNSDSIIANIDFTQIHQRQQSLISMLHLLDRIRHEEIRQIFGEQLLDSYPPYVDQQWDQSMATGNVQMESNAKSANHNYDNNNNQNKMSPMNINYSLTLDDAEEEEDKSITENDHCWLVPSAQSWHEWIINGPNLAILIVSNEVFFHLFFSVL